MFRPSHIALLLSCVVAGIVLTAAADDPPAAQEKPFGLAKRIPWTTSRVIGSPDPPLPYRTVRAFPSLKLKQPLSVDVEPGSSALWVIQHVEAAGVPCRIIRFVDKPDVTEKEVETVLNFDHLAYGVAFHPKFAENNLVFIGCNGQTESKEKRTRVFRYAYNREKHQLDPASRTLIIDWKSDGHNGGDLAFGLDGTLYVTAGDGTSDSDGWMTGQTLEDIPGACIRIDVDHPDQDKPYSIPKDNPFVAIPGARGEIWAYGLRNPWKISVDPKTGHLWIGNNGQDLWEQAYFVKKGDNFGWAKYEGNEPFQLERQLGPTPHTPPAANHHHSEARSLTGGRVYYGQKLPKLVGAYIYGDYSTGRIWGIKHNGERVTWHEELCDTPFAITGFGIDTHGELVVIDYAGEFYHLEPTPAAEPTQFPKKLSETGLFLSAKDHQVDPALVPYSVNAELWSDGAHKQRFIALPGTTQMEFGTNRGWSLPEGAVLVKTFSLDVADGDKTARRRIETRLLTKQQNEWVGYTYLWNDDQTDATLVEKKGTDKTYRVVGPDGVARDLAWHYPSRAECMVCHSRAANFVLGLTELQMNKDHDYGGVKDNQLRTLAHIGLFSNEMKEPEKLRRLVDPYDKSQPLDARARSYLHANCSICHIEAGGGNALMELEFTISREKMRVFDVRPQHHTYGIEEPRLIAPGHAERSLLLNRITRRGAGQMPPLATTMVDDQAATMLREWIESLGK